jgi:hypothetical protein
MLACDSARDSERIDAQRSKKKKDESAHVVFTDQGHWSVIFDRYGQSHPADVDFGIFSR